MGHTELLHDRVVGRSKRPHPDHLYVGFLISWINTQWDIAVSAGYTTGLGVIEQLMWDSVRHRACTQTEALRS